MTRETRYWVHSNPHTEPPATVCVACHDRPRWADTLMCGGCFVRLRSDIDALVTAHDELGQDMTALRGSRTDAGAHRPAGPRLPFDSHKHDLRCLIEARLVGWARIVAEEHQPAIHGPADGSLPTVGQWLANLLPWVSYQDWCDAMAAELSETALSARALVPTEPRRRELPGICPGCRLLTLVQYDGDSVVLCRNRGCGRRLTWGEYTAMFHGPTYKAPTSTEGVAA